MPSIVFVDQYAALGGGQTALLAMIESCLDSGWRVSVLAPMGGDFESALINRFDSRIRREHLPEMKLNAGKKTPLDAIKLVLGSLRLFGRSPFLREHDVVHVNGSRYFPIAAYLMKRIARPFFLHIHIDHSERDKKLIACAARLAAGIFVNSKFTLSRLVGVSPSKLILLRFGLSKTLSAEPFRERLGRDHAVVIGRLSREKGQDIVCEAARQTPEITYHLIGATDFQDAAYGEDLKRIAPSNVVFEGKSLDIKSTIDRIDPRLSIVPSQWEEPFGLVAVESMALSLRTLTSGRGGLKEISEETGNSVFSSIENLVSLVRSFVSDARLQHDRAVQAFGWDQFHQAFQLSLRRAIK